MRRVLLTAAAGLVAVASLLPSLTPVTVAASNSAGGGQALEISPPVITMTVNPGQVVHTQISIRDVSNGPLVVDGQSNDFVAAGEDGTPKILLNNKEKDPYSLKDWVAPLPELTLTPKQIKNLPVTINVPKNASPGGHYGVIRFTATPPDLKGQGVSLSASLGSLVLLTVRGDIKHKLSVQSFKVEKNNKPGSLFESTPVTLVEQIKNTGNVHEEPTGMITIKDMFGHTVARAGVNQSLRNVLPGSTRMFSEPLDKAALGSRKLFGRYTASMKLTYGPNKTVLAASVSFWIIPWKLIIGIIILLILGFFLIRYLIRRHDQKVMERIKRQSYKK